MSIVPPVIPRDTFLRLFTVFECIRKPVKTTPRKRLHWTYKGKAQLYLFMEGQVSFLRMSDGLVLGSVYEPHLLGVAEAIQPLRGHMLRIDTESTIYRVDAEQAKEKFNELSLWEDISIILSYYNSYYLYRDYLINQQQTYLIVLNHLQDLMRLPLDARLKTPILKYIQERTTISRSSILNVIATLKSNSFIETKRGGYLLNILTLPKFG